MNTYLILVHVSSCDEGLICLSEIGAKQFLMTVQSEDEGLKDVIDKILSNLVNSNPFSQTHAINDLTSDISQSSISVQQHTLKRTKNDFSVQISNDTQRSLPQPNQLHSSHMEILHKNQCLKEICELPLIYLSEDDEKLIFDLSVQLKFGDFKTLRQATQQLDFVLQDFPVEVLLQRTDTIKALLDLLEGGSSGQTAFSNLAQQYLIQLAKRLRVVYKFNTNNLTKKSQGNEIESFEYLKMSYPSCREGVWNTLEAVSDVRKYGASSDRSLVGTLQGSLSCRAVLGLILTKSVYLLKDTEKIGLYNQLINESWKSVQMIYRTEGNAEFTELFHLILFAFDSVFDFYRDQVFTEVLMSPVLEQALVFIDQLNRISNDQRDRFKNPYSETFFKNTEKLQMTLRRGLFTMSLTKDQTQTILDFFERMEKDLPQVNLLQKQVMHSYNRALDAYRRFVKVHNYRLSGNSFDDMCFVDSLPQLTAALDILETLQQCIELKIDFPFEHLICDCIVYAQLLLEQQPNDTKAIDSIEKIFITYLQIPVSEIRERIFRRLFQKVRLVQALQQKQVNNYLLAKFCYRKRVLNQFVNGILINPNIANEMTKLQIDVGTLVIKILVLSHGESNLKAKPNLNSFLLTFQSLLQKYPDLLALIDFIEENQMNSRFLRLLRDIYNKQPSKREFSTQILHKQMSKDSQQTDLLSSILDVKDPCAEMASELDLVNMQYDFAQFDIVNIQSILMNARSDYSLRKSSLEQLILLLFDQQNRRGKCLFTVNGTIMDVFTFCISEILNTFKTALSLGESVSELPHDQQIYLEYLLKFLTFAHLFYSEETVIKTFFDNLRLFSSSQKCADQFEQMLQACVFFTGHQLVRKQALRLLFCLVFNPVLLKTQVSKIGSRKLVQVLIPDFCPQTFLIIMPYQVQVVRQPLREDLLLSSEQKDFVNAMLGHRQQQEDRQLLLQQVAQQFLDCKHNDYHKLMQSFEQLQNYYLANSLSELLNPQVCNKIQDVFRILPTKDFEFNFLTDFCMFTNQILIEEKQSKLVLAVCQGLKFHLLPYLYEIGVQSENFKIQFYNQLLDLIINLSRTPSIFKETILSPNLLKLLSDLFALCIETRHKVIQIISLDDFKQSDFKILLQTVQQHRLSNSFQGNCLVMMSIRTMINMQDQNRLEFQQEPQQDNLSATGVKVLEQFQQSGWITRFTESRDARLRCLSWDLLTQIVDYQFLQTNQSLFHQSIATLLRQSELYCVKIAVLKFVNKVCELTLNAEQSAESVKILLDAVSKQGFISQIHGILVQRESPLLMVSQLLKFLSNLLQIDSKKALPILTQLDYWTVLVELVNIEGLIRQDDTESRSIVIQLKQNLLIESQPKMNVVYMCLNSILDFLFQAMKRDSKLANLLIKTTQILPAIFIIIKTMLVSYDSMHELKLISVDNSIKIMHLALLHPRDHTLQLLHQFIDNPEEIGWQWILKMFQLVDEKQSVQFYGHIDVKLAICRFIAEYLLRVQQAGLKHNLDNMIQNFDFQQSVENQDLSSFSSCLLLEFGKVFRSLYVDQRDNRQQKGVPLDDYENSKIDICLCLSILCASSQAAKVQSVEQNLLRKIIEVCEENVQALSLAELQKLAQKQKPLDVRKFKYAQVNDQSSCEREVIRMLSLAKHILYQSSVLLQDYLFTKEEDMQTKSFVSQNALTKSTQLKNKKQNSQGEMLVSLFGLILEQISNSSIVDECLSCMVTMSSQNKKFKNSFLNPSASLLGSKRNTVMKQVVDCILKETLQSNTTRMQLLFAFLKSASLSPEVIREISKLRLIEEIQTSLEPTCKNEKDIKMLKHYLMHYAGFLAAYSYTEEGIKTIIALKQVFQTSLFIIDSVTPPSSAENPLTSLVLNILLFLRNSSGNRVGKQHFISDRTFLPCLMAFLSSRDQNQRVIAQTAACLWTCLFNHQGVKAALNNEQVRNELQLLQNEYQRTCDITKYAGYVTKNDKDTFNPDAFNIMDQKSERQQELIKKCEDFTLVALNGIITLLEA